MSVSPADHVAPGAVRDLLNIQEIPHYVRNDGFGRVLTFFIFSLLCFVLLLVSSNAFASLNDELIENDHDSRFDTHRISPLIHLSGKKDTLAIQVFPTPGSSLHSKWRILRHYPSGNIEIQYYDDATKDFKVVSIPSHFAINSYLMLTFGDQKKPYLLIYDVVRNIPSGRQLVVRTPGYDLYQLDADSEPKLKPIARGIDIGGEIDTLVYGHQVGSDVLLCATNQCMTLLPDGTKIKWKTEHISQYQFIELTFHNKVAYALVRLHHDDRSNGALHRENATIRLAKLSQEQTEWVPIHQNDAMGIPFHLQISKSGIPTWEMANNSKSLRTLFLYDLQRMPHHGWMDFGTNNLEGRIAWSQVYYLSGMISLLNQKSGLHYLPNNDLRKRISPTVLEELRLIARLSGYDYPGYLVKRYSVDRSPILFALHLARVATLLKQAQVIYKNNSQMDKATASICAELIGLNHTIEAIDVKKKVTMSYKQGYPFWADGVNVPYNYISGYIQGLLSACHSDKSIKMSAALIQPLLSDIHKNPMLWRYWSDIGDRGWSEQDRISINTPAWAGNNEGKAHITYRSIDAMAMLSLYQISPSAIPHKLLKHIQSLVRSGLLLPEVNQSLHDNKIPVMLDIVAAKFYARSTTPSEIPSQIWAIDALAKQIEIKSHSPGTSS